MDNAENKAVSEKTTIILLLINLILPPLFFWFHRGEDSALREIVGEFLQTYKEDTNGNIGEWLWKYVLRPPTYLAGLILLEACALFITLPITYLLWKLVSFVNRWD